MNVWPYASRPVFKATGVVWLERILCPNCLGVFATIYKERKSERCPYCGQALIHSDGLARCAAMAGEWDHRDVRAFAAWIEDRMELSLSWWRSNRSDVDVEQLKVLLGELDQMRQAAKTVQSRLQQGVAAHPIGPP